MSRPPDVAGGYRTSGIGDRPEKAAAHFTYVLRLGDDNLVLAQRYGEWISNAPELEEDIALGNIGLDHLGQARALLAHAAELEGAGRNEDDLAMFRTEREFTNLLLVERPNGDFADTMARAFCVDAFQVELWDALRRSTDPVLAGISAKALKEARYHLRHSSRWVIRLGDGTDESRERMQRGVNDCWRFTGEMFELDSIDSEAIESGVGVDVSALRPAWEATIRRVLSEATLTPPTDPAQQIGGGRQGRHTEALGHILAELQWMQRSYPGLQW